MDVQIINSARNDGAVNQQLSLRTVYVLLGGSGMKVGLRLRKRVFDDHGVSQLPFQRFLWLDTDRGDIANQDFGESGEVRERLRFTGADFVDMSLPAAAIGEMLNRPDHHPWVWQSITPSELRQMGSDAAAVDGAAQQRALGRIAFGQVFPNFRGAMDRHVDALFQPEVPLECNRIGVQLDGGLEIVVICSIAGGTGAGAFLDACVALRQLYKDRGVKISAYFLLPGVFRQHIQANPSAWMNVQANAYAALQELSALASVSRSNRDRRRFLLPGLDIPDCEGFPLHEVFLVDAINLDGQTMAGVGADDAYEMVADALFLELEQSAFGTKKRSHRCNVRPHLASFTEYSLPVQDPNFATNDCPRYVFHLPNAFGCFGTARMPFDRARLQRAAGAWLNRKMLSLIINDANVLDPSRIRALLREQYGQIHGLSVEGVINKLLQDGQGAFFYESEGQQFVNKLAELRERMSRELATDGLRPKELLGRLRRASQIFEGLTREVHALAEEVFKRVERLLRADPAMVMEGEHHRSIRMNRTPIRVQCTDALGVLSYRLLANPRDYGLGTVEAALSLLERDYREVSGAVIEPTRRPELPPATFTLPDEVADVMDRLDEANAIPGLLVLYKQVAVQLLENDAEKETTHVAESARVAVRRYLADVEGVVLGWTKDRYQQAARSSAQSMFAALAGDIGSVEVIKHDDGSVTQRATGLREQFDAFRSVAKRTIDRFEGMENSYRSVRPSDRNAADVGERAPLDEEARQLIETNAPSDDDRPDWYLEVAWRTWFRTSNVVAATNQQDLLEAGLKEMVNRAKEYARNVSRWNSAMESLEQWAVKYFQDKKLLMSHDVISLMARDGAALRAGIQHVHRSSAPYLRFSPGAQVGGALTGVIQKADMMGVPDDQAEAVVLWRRDGHSGTELVKNGSGGISFYREQMAFPLHLVDAVRQCEDAYLNLRKERPAELVRRHTVLDPSDLPTIRPPASDDEATRWFELDVLCLEAALLGLFHAVPAGEAGGPVRIEYVYEDHNRVRQTTWFSSSLRAVGALVRNSPTDALKNRLRDHVSSHLTAAFRASGERRPEPASSLIRLSTWTQNQVFPAEQHQGRQLRYLEHEVARAVAKKWSVIWTKQWVDSRIATQADMESRISELSEEVTEASNHVAGCSASVVTSAAARRPLLCYKVNAR